MKGMRRKEQGHDKTPQGKSRHGTKNPIKQHGVQGMEQKVYQMEPARIEPEHFHVRHVTDPRQGMPVRKVKRRKCPPDVLNREPLVNAEILLDVMVIIVVHKIEACCLRVDDHANQEENYRKDITLPGRTARPALRNVCH